MSNNSEVRRQKEINQPQTNNKQSAGTVLPTFFVIGIAFIPIGIGMLWFSDNVSHFDPEMKMIDTSYRASLSQKFVKK